MIWAHPGEARSAGVNLCRTDFREAKVCGAAENGCEPERPSMSGKQNAQRKA